MTFLFLLKGEVALKRIIFDSFGDVLLVKEVQEILSISRHQVYHLIETKQIRGIKVGKAYKIPKVSVIDYFLGTDTNTQSDSN